MSDRALDADTKSLIDHLKSASPRMQAKAKLVAAIGVIMHSKLPIETRADMVMATVESCMLDIELALVMHLTETCHESKRIGGTSMDICVALMGLELMKAINPAQDRMKNIAALFEGELAGPHIQL